MIFMFTIICAHMLSCVDKFLIQLSYGRGWVFMNVCMYVCMYIYTTPYFGCPDQPLSGGYWINKKNIKELMPLFTDYS
jgi:hypothetical protein